MPSRKKQNHGALFIIGECSFFDKIFSMLSHEFLHRWGAAVKKRIGYQPDLSADPPTAESRERDFSYSVSAPITITSLTGENAAIDPATLPQIGATVSG